MEARVVFYNLVKSWLILLIFCIFGVITALLYSLSDESTYTASTLLYLRPQAASSTSEGDYFAQERLGSFTDTFASLISSEEGQEEAGVAFRVRKIAPQLLRISTTAQSEIAAKENLARTLNYSEEELNSLTAPSDNFVSLQKTNEDLRVIQRVSHTPLNLLVGLILGSLLGAVFVALREYFSPNKK